MDRQRLSVNRDRKREIKRVWGKNAEQMKGPKARERRVRGWAGGTRTQIGIRVPGKTN